MGDDAKVLCCLFLSIVFIFASTLFTTTYKDYIETKQAIEAGMEQKFIPGNSSPIWAYPDK